MFFPNLNKALLFAVPLPFIVTLVAPLSFYLANHSGYPITLSTLLNKE